MFDHKSELNQFQLIIQDYNQVGSGVGSRRLNFILAHLGYNDFTILKEYKNSHSIRLITQLNYEALSNNRSWK